MRIKFLLLVLFAAYKLEAQLIANLQFPSTGLLYKPQLWTMVLTNTTGAPLDLHVEVILSEIGTSQQVLSGVTKAISLVPGTNHITPVLLFPIQYNVLSASYIMDNNPNGLLPIGHFEICYNFFKHQSDDFIEILEQCQDITIEPLSPPQLIYPYDATAIEESNPQFSWMPPIPATVFSNLNYDLTLVEINPNQSPSDAINQNIPLYQATNLSGNTLLYPFSAPSIQFEKQYAWKVVAKTGSSAVASTEVWQFMRKQYGALNLEKPTELPFAKPKKDPESGYVIFDREIKLDYFNETSDSVWQVSISDLSSINKKGRPLLLDDTPLKSGQNLVRYPIEEDEFFIDKHMYEIEIFNSRKENWRLRFQFRKAEKVNN